MTTPNPRIFPTQINLNLNKGLKRQFSYTPLELNYRHY